MTNYPEYSQIKGAAPQTVTVEGNIATDTSTRMSISDEGTVHIMSLLTDLYSNPNLAVLREYSSNALDSHKEAGQTRPIEVTLPSNFNPVFVVKDFGIGMSADTIRTIYSSYGASTKRKDFTQVGAFGLGCKAALTMTQQFTLVSIKDGRKSTAIISRDEDGVGSVNVVAEMDTTEENGVTVTVPIKDPHLFNSAVEDFFFTWEAGTVLVDGVAPASASTGEYFRTTSGHTLIGSKQANTGFLAVMGGISYRVRFSELGINNWGNSVETQFSNLCARTLHVISDVPIGSIDLTPSREDIRYSTRTTKFLRGLFDQIITEIPEFIESQIKDAKTRREVLKAMIYWNTLSDLYRAHTKSKGGASHSIRDILWNGERVPSSIPHDAARLNWSPQYSNSTRRRHRVDKNFIFQTDIIFGEPHKTHYIIVEKDEDLHAKVVRELPFWMDDKSSDGANYSYLLNGTRFFLVTEMPTSEWVTDNEMFVTIPSDDIFKIATETRKAERTAKRAAQPQVMYPVISITGDTIQYNNIGHLDLKATDYYVEAETSELIDRFMNTRSYGRQVPRSISSSLKDLGLTEDDRIIYIAKTRKIGPLVKRAGISFLPLSTLITTHRDALISGASDLQKVYAHLMMGGGGGASAILTNLNRFKKVLPLLEDGSDLKKVMEDRNKAIDFSAKYATLTTTFTAPPLSVDTKESVEFIESLDERYPLLRLTDPYGQKWADEEHYAMYINAVDGKE